MTLPFFVLKTTVAKKTPDVYNGFRKGNLKIYPQLCYGIPGYRGNP